MGPKRSLSPTAAAAALADAKRQAVEEQRLRAEEWAKKMLKSSPPKKTARSSIGGIAITKDYKDDSNEIEATPVRLSKKRLSSILPVSSTKLSKKAKNDESHDGSDNDDADSSKYEKQYRPISTPNRRSNVVKEIFDVNNIELPVPIPPTSTPKRRRNFNIPEESLNSALNPPKYLSSTAILLTSSSFALHSGDGNVLAESS